MPKVIAPSRRYLVALAREVEEGEVVEVGEADACSLVEQGWEPAPDEPTTSPAPRRAGTKPAAGDAPADPEE